MSEERSYSEKIKKAKEEIPISIPISAWKSMPEIKIVFTIQREIFERNYFNNHIAKVMDAKDNCREKAGEYLLAIMKLRDEKFKFLNNRKDADIQRIAYCMLLGFVHLLLKD